MVKIASVLAVLLLAGVGPARAATTYYADPARGAAENDGSEARPWRTLQEVAAGGKIRMLKGGDTLVLNTGYHGDVKLSGENEATVTIAAGKGQRPTLSRLLMPGGSNWTIRGLVISPSFGPPYAGDMVSIGDRGPTTKVTIEDCYLFTAEDSSAWDAKQWMAANSAILLGRQGRELAARNNYVRNVRFGISMSSFDSVCEGNVVTDFSGDGLRTVRDGGVVRYNVVKNGYVGERDGDGNHDDLLQCFPFNLKDGSGVKNVKVIGNIFIAHESPDQKLVNSIQGIGFFDGPLVDFVIADNVVNSDAYHGIALYDARNSTIERNVVYTEPGRKVMAWIMLGTKPKVGGGKGNTVRDNFANKFILKEAGAVTENNKVVTREIYEDALARAYKVICDKFGEKHATAGAVRMELKKRPATRATGR